MTKTTKTTLWTRTTRALGKLLEGMVLSHDSKHTKAAEAYPRFPMF